MTSQKINRNSYEFSLDETSSLKQVDQDQNPSWINLRSLKDMIRHSSTDRALNFEDENLNNNKNEKKDYDSRNLLPPQQNYAKNAIRSNLRNSVVSKSQHFKEQNMYNSNGFSSSRVIRNPYNLLKVEMQNNDFLQQYNSLTSDSIQYQDFQNIQRNSNNLLRPLETSNNYFSNDDVNYNQQTLIMNHVDTPQSIVIPEMRGQEIESLLKDDILGNLLNSADDHANMQNHIELAFDHQTSPYGKTQEFDILNHNQNDECINYIQQITQDNDSTPDDNKTEMGQITHRKNQPSQARESIVSRQSVGQVEIKQINLNIENQQKKLMNLERSSTKVQIVSHSRKASQLIDLTKRSFDNFQPQKQVVTLNLVENVDDKENQNPYQTHTGLPSKQQNCDDQESLSLRLVDKEFDQFCEQIEKMRSHNNLLSVDATLPVKPDTSFKRKKQLSSVDRIINIQQNTPKKQTPHQSLELSESQSSKSPLTTSMLNVLQTETAKDFSLQQSPAAQIDQTMQQSFKRDKPKRNLRKHIQNKSLIGCSAIQLTENSVLLTNQQKQKFIDVSQIEQQSSLDMSSMHSLEQNVIQDELQELNQRQRQLDHQKKGYDQQINQLKSELNQQQQLSLKEVEEENLIIQESLKQEYEDKLQELKNKHEIHVQQLNQEHQREILHKQDKLERKRDKLYKLRDQFDDKRKEYNSLLSELEAYKSKVEEMTQYQLQNCASNGGHIHHHSNKDSTGNLFMTSQSCEQIRDPLSYRNDGGFYTSRGDNYETLDNKVCLFSNIEDDMLHQFRNSDHKQPTPYQSFDNFLEMKKRSAEQHQNLIDIPNIIKNLNSNSIVNVNHSDYKDDPNLNFYFSLSQQQQQHQQIVSHLNYQEHDSAMNFSFSEVKTSLDNKSCFFDKHNHNSLNHNNEIRQQLQAHLICKTTDTQVNNRDGFKSSLLDIISQNDDEEIIDYQYNNASQNSTQLNVNDTQHNPPQYESDNDENQSLIGNDNNMINNQQHNSIQKYLELNSKVQSQKGSSLQHSPVRHQESEPISENYVDDELETEDIPNNDNNDDDDEESKSNLSYKIDDITSTSQRILTSTINQNVIYQIDEDDDYSNGNELISRRIRQHQDLEDVDEGSENAPEDSGFLSDDAEQERIVNESSLYQDEFGQSQNLLAQTVSGDPYLLYSDAFEDQSDPNLIMTGRSESAMDDNDDEIEGISKCKAINSSYINLKRNNLLIAYGRK
eukprot:403344018